MLNIRCVFNYILNIKKIIFAYFFFAEAALEHLKAGDCIINTTSVTAYRSSPSLIDYSSTKGAITTFTRSLATNLTEKNIRVNAVAPGPVWTPLIVSSFDEEQAFEGFRSVPKTPLGNPVSHLEIYSSANNIRPILLLHSPQSSTK